MSDGAIDNLSDIKVSKVTLSFLCSLVGLAGFITWNASSIANRIGELEETVVVMQQANNGAEDISWQLGDLFHRTDVMMSIMRENLDGAQEQLDREFGPNWGW